MRLDVFLPVLRTPKAGGPPRGRIYRWLRRVLPGSWFSDPQTKRRGLARRWLRWLGPTWLSAPLRRVVQTVCFVLFLYLFFYVCWPYSARPYAPSTDWLPADVNGQTAETTVVRDVPAAEPLPVGQTVYVLDQGSGADVDLGPFVVRQAAATEAQLAPAEALTPEQLEAVSLSTGPWTISKVPADHWPSHYTDNLAAKEHLAAEFFLVIDPLVSLSTAIAARSWVWSLTCAAIILGVCIVIPRGFCGYLCPLGTLIDLFDSVVGRRITRFRAPPTGWWVHIKYYLLVVILLAAFCGVLLSGFVAAIPVITRGFLMLFGPLQTGWERGWHQMPPFGIGHAISLLLFAAVLGLGLLQPRFWCKYVCPSGAVFSLGNLFRASERKVESSCIHCNKCVEICPFDAIKADFTTRTADCTLCQTCAGVCPTQAIKFVERWNLVQLKVENDPPTRETPLGRRGFLATAAGVAAGAAGGMFAGLGTRSFGAGLGTPGEVRPVRPPGSVPEAEFLQMCIRCGECFKACPNDVLQPLGFAQGLEGLWTPYVNADWAGCESSCNACTQVCPTGAIRAIPLEEKRVARMGLALVNQTTCLPIAGREACQLCVDECQAAGYDAIEFTRVGTQVDDQGQPIEGTGFLAPVVLADKCVGCGLCQTRCYAINVAEKKLLDESAIVIEAGEGREDRLMSGSYLALRAAEEAARAAAQPKAAAEYLPEFLRTP